MKLQINKLPLDILFIIIPYTYKPQSKELCLDIINFHNVRKIIVKQYSERYDNTIDNKYDWISNDVTRFMNKDLPTLFCGYHQCYVDKICRLFLMKDKNKEETTNFIIKLVDNKSVTFETNLRIALLKPKERDLLVNFMRMLC